MHRLFAATLAFSILVLARPAWPCGAPIQVAPGYPGTALAEGPDQISVFTGSPTGYSWDRLQVSTGQRTHVADINGVLAGNIETNAQSDRAIAAQAGQIVEVSATGAIPISDDADAATTIFGAALDPSGNWQVLAYDAANARLALFGETAPGSFQKMGEVVASCGKPEMLDTIVEPDGTFVGLCAGSPVLLSNGALELATLPTPAIALGRASNGDAVFYGRGETPSILVRMSRSGAGWSIDDTLYTRFHQVNWLIPVSDVSIVASTDSGFVAFSRGADGQWSNSAPLDGADNVTSAFGAPAQVLDGQYELSLYSYSSASSSWQSKDLGAMGTAPVYKASPAGGMLGCSSADGTSLLSLLGLALVLVHGRRRLARR